MHTEATYNTHLIFLNVFNWLFFFNNFSSSSFSSPSPSRDLKGQSHGTAPPSETPPRQTTGHAPRHTPSPTSTLNFHSFTFARTSHLSALLPTIIHSFLFPYLLYENIYFLSHHTIPTSSSINIRGGGREGGGGGRGGGEGRLGGEGGRGGGGEGGYHLSHLNLLLTH